MSKINTIQGKVIITGTLQLLTGLHIGTSGDFSAIGAVDNIVIRDSITNKPMIPGSSLKGKMRFLLARTKYAPDSLTMEKIEDENAKIKRLFGASKPIVYSRLQFQDILLSDDSERELRDLDLDLPYGEVKYENTIDRMTGIANPRQQERVPAGAEFDLRLVYNIENKEELHEDIENIALLFELLQDDYLGGHGTRGYGRVKFHNLKAEIKTYDDKHKDLHNETKAINEKLESKVK
ncbi:MAG: type III-A CRISPR-associated RAMP protein Csm3 [Peptostreptococcaceae bacterium]|nr:type III-A CRISPR-associated RAMP protein Csm3 [Peptostreptococcaceae bacterium]